MIMFLARNCELEDRGGRSKEADVAHKSLSRRMPNEWPNILFEVGMFESMLM